MTMVRIARADATGSSPIIELNNIPGTYTDLVVKYLFRGTQNTFFIDGNFFRVNGSTSGYSWRRLWNVASSGGTGTSMSFGLIGGAATTTNCFTIGEMYIPNYAGNLAKSFSYDSSTETNTTTDGFYMMMYAGLWDNTAPITSITFNINSGNFASGSFIEIYGVTKGSDGVTTVS